MNKKPLVSLANLVEYATTPSAARRRQIIEQYHHPEVIRFDWHGASDTIFAERARGSTEADNLIDLEKRRLNDQKTGNPERDRRCSHILHLVELLETSDVLRLTEGTDPSTANNLAIDSIVGSLTVRVRPNLVLSRQRLGWAAPEMGILKCHNLSTFKLSGYAGPLYAVGLQIYAENIVPSEVIAPNLCRVYDLFHDKVYMAPKNQKRLRVQLVDAAQEILDRWDAVGKRLTETMTRKRKAG
ncbi:MAG: hypothetical protein WBA36_18430 [Mesorhizobium sp.]